MTSHDHDRATRALKVKQRLDQGIAVGRDQLVDAIEDLKAADAPELVPLYEELQQRLAKMDQGGKSPPPSGTDFTPDGPEGDICRQILDLPLSGLQRLIARLATRGVLLRVGIEPRSTEEE